MLIATGSSKSFMITDADKQDETMELGQNLDQGNFKHSTSKFARICCYIATLRTELMANLIIIILQDIYEYFNTNEL